jgi:hypothetical protein
MNEEHKKFLDGVTHGRNQVITELLEKSDKLQLIHALFTKASQFEAQETDPVMKAKLDGYSEGFRHSLNILENLGDALEAYENIINPSIKVPLTRKEMSLLGENGH